jgi:phenylpropionate dioxygenase-like ring-hydroxylating dioxygenase large terminal subunit
MKSRYHHKIPEHDPTLTHVERGSPMGEMLRRYWQPVCTADELGDLPKRVRIMCEDLVVFRDGADKTGCLELHCPHRGTSLEWGRVEDDGLRCCYHGWKFATDGQCIDMACETPEFREKMDVWQPGYPTHEFGGLVFIYMGPPAEMPLFPMYDILDTRYRDDVELRGMRLWEDHAIGYVRDCNWLQHYENVIDAYHLLILHAANSGDQFGSVVTTTGWPDLDFEETELGVRYNMRRNLPNGNRLERHAEVVLPNISLIPSIHEQGTDAKYQSRATEVSWCVPVDNEHLYGISIVAWPKDEAGKPVKDWKPGTDTVTDIRPGNLRERPYEDKQRNPDDMEAQESQRPIAIHALENLASSDRGIVLLRRQLRRSLDRISAGEDPANIIRDDAANHAIETHAWNTVILPDATGEAAE